MALSSELQIPERRAAAPQCLEAASRDGSGSSAVITETTTECRPPHADDAAACEREARRVCRPNQYVARRRVVEHVVQRRLNYVARAASDEAPSASLCVSCHRCCWSCGSGARLQAVQYEYSVAVLQSFQLCCFLFPLVLLA